MQNNDLMRTTKDDGEESESENDNDLEGVVISSESEEDDKEFFENPLLAAERNKKPTSKK